MAEVSLVAGVSPGRCAARGRPRPQRGSLQRGGQARPALARWLRRARRGLLRGPEEAKEGKVGEGGKAADKKVDRLD